jgi:RNA recognition motif-containing protein
MEVEEEEGEEDTHKVLFVENIPEATAAEDLKSLFSQYG